MDRMAQAIAAALRVLNPAQAEPLAPGEGDRPGSCDNCDKRADNCDKIPPRAT